MPNGQPNVSKDEKTSQYCPVCGQEYLGGTMPCQCFRCGGNTTKPRDASGRPRWPNEHDNWGALDWENIASRWRVYALDLERVIEFAGLPRCPKGYGWGCTEGSCPEWVDGRCKHKPAPAPSLSPAEQARQWTHARYLEINKQTPHSEPSPAPPKGPIMARCPDCGTSFQVGSPHYCCPFCHATLLEGHARDEDGPGWTRCSSCGKSFPPKQAYHDATSKPAPASPPKCLLCGEPMELMPSGGPNEPGFWRCPNWHDWDIDEDTGQPVDDRPASAPPGLERAAQHLADAAARGAPDPLPTATSEGYVWSDEAQRYVPPEPDPARRKLPCDCMGLSYSRAHCAPPVGDHPHGHRCSDCPQLALLKATFAPEPELELGECPDCGSHTDWLPSDNGVRCACGYTRVDPGVIE